MLFVIYYYLRNDEMMSTIYHKTKCPPLQITLRTWDKSIKYEPEIGF